MIRRDRRTVKAPSAYLRRAREPAESLRAFYDLERRKRSQRRPPDERAVLADESLRKALLKLFEGKCAYCESPLATVFDVDRFRPANDAMGLTGRSDPDHYWWLAYSWENLYAACPACNSAKGSRFPVRGERAAPGAGAGDLAEEKRLLLDPCADEPEVELQFSADGTVAGATERGEISIDVFALNRRDLVRARRSAAEKLDALLVSMSKKELLARQKTLVSASAAYAAMQRQLIAKHLGQEPVASQALKRQRAETGAVWLEEIHLENFKTISRLSIEFPEHRTRSEREPWLMLLGVNGVGKSSVLQAIALPFMTASNRSRYVPDASKLVNRNNKDEPAGHVRLSFSDGTHVTLRFRRGQREFELEGRLPPLNAYAYGSTRLPPEPGARRDDRPRERRLNNLFDPRYPLTVAEEWMADPDRVPSRSFTFLARALHQLLELDEEDRIARRRGVLEIQQGGLSLPVSEHSDGYRSIVAFAADLMLNLSARWDSVSAAEGLVLVDELEVHLHPTWRMTVVELLRNVFPRLRFVITTHDPLCLRGAEPREVHVLRRDDETREVLSVQRDIPPGLTADELLTGSWFGMATTLDEGTIALMQEHSELLIAKPTAAVGRRRAEVEAQLRERRGAFADSDDERLVRSVVAELRDQDPDLAENEREAARDAVLRLAQEARSTGRAAP